MVSRGCLEGGSHSLDSCQQFAIFMAEMTNENWFNVYSLNKRPVLTKVWIGSPHHLPKLAKRFVIRQGWGILGQPLFKILATFLALNLSTTSLWVVGHENFLQFQLWTQTGKFTTVLETIIQRTFVQLTLVLLLLNTTSTTCIQNINGFDKSF